MSVLRPSQKNVNYFGDEDREGREGEREEEGVHARSLSVYSHGMVHGSRGGLGGSLVGPQRERDGGSGTQI